MKDNFWLLIVLAILGVLSFEFRVHAEDRIKIGIIDSGISVEQAKSAILCKDGLKSTFSDGIDTDEHGTNIFYLVSRNLDPKKFCIISYQFPVNNSGMSHYLKALRQAMRDRVKYLNLSLEGSNYNTTERKILAIMLYRKTKISVAAGNDFRNLDNSCNVYPACYEFICNEELFAIIGAKDTKFSNYGSIIKSYENGFKQGIPEKSGTSQATAVYANKIILKDFKNVVY